MRRIAILLVAVWLGACGRGGDDVKVSVTDDDNIYVFSASFPARRTAKVVRFINRRIEPNHLNENASGTTTLASRLNDMAPYELKVSKGDIKFVFDKKGQSGASFDLVKEFAEDLKDEILKGN